MGKEDSPACGGFGRFLVGKGERKSEGWGKGRCKVKVKVGRKFFNLFMHPAHR